MRITVFVPGVEVAKVTNDVLLPIHAAVIMYGERGAVIEDHRIGGWQKGSLRSPRQDLIYIGCPKTRGTN